MKHTALGHSITFIAQDWDKHSNFTHEDLSTVGNYDSDSSIKITERHHVDKNTWENWGLVPESRPTLSLPSQKTKIAESNMTNGIFDMSWKSPKYPLFGNREGSFTFIYNPIYQQGFNKYKPWLVLYSEICEFLHGKQLRMVLEDDPEYYYEGRFWVGEWTSNNDGSGSTVTINYSVFPYKISILSSLNEWYWDPFNFYNGIIATGLFTIEIEHSDTINQKETYYDIVNTDQNGNHSPDWYGKTGESDTKLDLTGLMGTLPQIPTIYWKPEQTNYNESSTLSDAIQRCLIVNFISIGNGINYGKSGIRYKYFDPLGSYGEGISISSSGVQRLSNIKDSDGFYKFEEMDMIFADNYMGEEQFIQFIGNGTVKIEFHRGSL